MAGEKNRKRNTKRPEDKVSTDGREVVFSRAQEEEDAQEIAQRKRSPLHVVSVLLRLFIFGVLLAIGLCVYQAWVPVKLSSVQGYFSIPGEIAQSAPDLGRLIKRAQAGNYPLVLSEEDINRYLKKVILGKQAGPLGVLARYEGVAVKLHEGYAEVILVRRVGSGYRQTVSLFMRPSAQESLEGPIVVVDYTGPPLVGSLSLGGRWGRLPVPQGFMKLDKVGFEALASSLKPELEYLLDVSRPIVIKKGELTIQAAAH